MDKKSETKRQHYVPRLLLRKFSEDGKTIDLALLESGKVVSQAAIKGQCYEDYFYGDDGVMEKSFAAEESLIGAYLSDLSAEHLRSFGPEVHDKLRRFVHYQRMRTQGTANAMNDQFDAFLKTAFAPAFAAAHPELPPDALDSIQIKLSNPQSEALWAAGCSAPLLEDLAVRFIVTTTAPGFVISDHPVVAYNQFAQTHPKFRDYPFTTRLEDKGLQLFLPLSPQVVLAVYDPTTYASSEREIVCHASKRDVVLLNSMQALNGVKCLYFNANRTSSGALRRLLRARDQHGRAGRARASAGEMKHNPDGTMTQLVVTMRAEIRLGASLNCFRSTDAGAYGDYHGATLPPRNPALVEFTEWYREHLNGKVDRARSRRGLAPYYGAED